MTPIQAPPRPAAHPFADTPAERLRLASAPSTGRFRPAVGPGDHVLRGQAVGHVTGSRERADVVAAPADGVVSALLVRPGQLVGKHRALVWLHEDDA